MKVGAIFDFEGHTLDVGLGRLWRGGEEIALRPKSLALLVYFLEHPGRVIGKDELISSVWPDVTVSDDSLSQCLKDIRALLGPEAGGFLRTVPRRGYLVDESRMRRRNPDAVPRQARPSIEVLPFRPLADDREHHWFAEGIVEDVTVALCRSGRLVVMPCHRLGSEGSKPGTATPTAGMDDRRYLLQGSVRLDADNVRVSAQLIEARTGELIWAEKFDRKLIDIFSIQDEITGAIVSHLEIELLPEEWRAIQLSRTEDIEAYTYYRHGRQLARHWTKSYLSLARRMFVKATEIDPGFARAYAGLVLCDCYLMEWHATEQRPQDVLAMAGKAMELDAQLAEAHAARGFALYRSGRMDEAEASYEHALQIDRGCYEARLFAGILASIRGRRDAAKSHFTQAANLWREDYVATCFVVCHTLRSDPARLDWARLAFERAERIAALQPENPAPLSRGAIALAHLGEARKAVSWITRAQTIDPDDLITQYNAAIVYALLGDPGQALGILKNYLPKVSGDMIDVIRTDADLDGIRSHPGYGELFEPYADEHGSPPGTVRNDTGSHDFTDILREGKEMQRSADVGRAKAEDFPAIRDLCNDFLDWCRSRYGENAWFVDHYYTPEKWAALLDSLPRIHSAPEGEALVARVNGKVVGCVMMQRIDEQTCEMKRMFVGPDGRGLGLGRRLAENIIHVAAERGYTAMRLDTGRNHDEALGLYRSLGFEEIAPYYQAPPELQSHLVFMEVRLNS